VLERAVEHPARRTHAPATTDGHETSGSDDWQVDDGIRTIRILAHPGQRYPSVGVLWPNMAEPVAHWRRTKGSQPYAAGLEMQGRLAAAGIDPPKWPR
jgi:hypothetical protein